MYILETTDMPNTPKVALFDMTFVLPTQFFTMNKCIKMVLCILMLKTQLLTR